MVGLVGSRVPLGKTFDRVIEEELTAARCVIVCGQGSGALQMVKTEAATAADQEQLIPVIEDVAIPFEFKHSRPPC
jgi:hypothetical protein